MELTSTPYIFEILQIESVSLFFVILGMAVYTWRSFRESEVDTTHNQQSWILFFVVIFLALTGAFLYSLGPTYFILAIELAFGIVLAVLRPVNALALFVCLMFLRPWEISQESSLLLALPRMMGLLAIVSAVSAYLRSDVSRLRFGRAQWLLLAFAVWALLTTFIAPNPGEQQSEYFDTFFRALIVFFLIVAVVRTEGDLAMFRQVYLWSVAGLAGVSVYLSWDNLGEEIEGTSKRLQAIGSLENANDIAAVMIVGIPFALRRMSQSRQPLVWIESFFFLGLTLFALYLAQSRGALLALGAGGLGYWFLRSKRRWLIVILGISAVGAVAPFANDLLRRDQQDLHESGASRLNYWKAGIKMVLRSPVLGVGFGRYPKEYQQYAGSGEQYEFGERTAHSTWILALAETGVPGLLLFVGFVAGILMMARKIIPFEPDLFVSLVAYLIAISFLSHTYLMYPYILMGLVVAAYRMQFRSKKGWAL